jgi:hypothetical protein
MLGRALPEAQRTQRSMSSGAGRQLFASDVEVAFALLNEARYRTLQRVFGVSRTEANLATAIGALVLLEAAHLQWKRMMRGPSMPATADMFLGTATLREGLSGIAGASPTDAPTLGTLLMLAMLAGPTRRAVRSGLRDVRARGHRMNAGFHKRYGYMIDPGHLRARLAERRESKAATAAP